MTARLFKMGSPLDVSIALVDADDNELAPVGTPRWRVLDERELVVMDWQPVVPVYGAITLHLTSEQTTLPAGVFFGLRILEAEVVTSASGTVTFRSEVMLRGASLTVPSHSFQTYGQACLTAVEVSRLDGWTGADKEAREQALIEACRRISMLNFTNRINGQMNMLDYTSGSNAMSLAAFRAGGNFVEPYRLITQLSSVEFAALNPLFLDALRLSQVLEADALLMAIDPIAEAREAGAISIKVGESSQSFLGRKKLELGVNRRAYEVIAPWLSRGVRIGRG